MLGLSGGADSVCLFLVLEALAEEWELELLPVHVNHNLRGEEAVRDQAFCEELCRQHNKKLRIVSVQVAALAREHGWSLEEAGRNARYTAFEELSKELSCSKIAVAHHKNDQAETVLFQLLRGSRLKGLSGMEAKNGTLVRPLLCVSREEIETFLAESLQKYCIDRTNLEEGYTRNKIRHRMLPLAEELQPRAAEHLADTAEYLGQVEKLLERLTETLFTESAAEDAEGRVLLKIEPLRRAERILAERVVYKALCRAYGKMKDITAGFVTDCMALLEKQTGRYLTLPSGVRVKKQFDSLLIGREISGENSYYEEVTAFPYQTVLPENGRVLTLALEEIAESGQIFSEKIGPIPKNNYTKWFDYDKIKGVVSLRTLRAADVIALYADGRGKRVTDVLKEAKVPLEKRQSVCLLAAEDRVLWIPGIRGSEDYHVTEETKRILIATIDGGNEDGR